MGVKTHSFKGVRYRITQIAGVDGITNGENMVPEVINCAVAGTQNELITWIHEGMHASNWFQSEETVDQSSKDIGRLLWRLGYRRPKVTKNES
jgi:hypothetical protein